MKGDLRGDVRLGLKEDMRKNLREVVRADASGGVREDL